ncbi:MAG: acyl-CoA dehydrogenase C-terminal domain-containing protein [Alphaproteobacteria bacterium]
MTIYKAPLRDFRFVLHEVLEAEAELKVLRGCEEVSGALIDRVLEEAARLAESELFPLNRSGDEEGCTLVDGAVSTPKGFKEAFRRYAEGGWCGLAGDPAFGGQGLPQILAVPVIEIMGSANLSFSDYTILVSMAAETIGAHATDELKVLYLPRLLAGEWAATMCMTEPHCGTDVGLLKTRAEPADDGTYRVTGTKIFISGGDHDLTPNIAHLVLARLAGAPAGTRGISLFLVPKVIPRADGSLGERNTVFPVGIEHKMGYAASATCTMSFEGARAWLVGEPNRGLAAMFTMVNSARLAVGLQGLSLAEVAYQSASAYARERVQGRSAAGPAYPERAADPLVVHADVRRMLLSTRAFTEGARAIALWLALAIDRSTRHPDAEAREEASDLVSLLTPVVKAGFSDLGFESCNLAMQVFGGHGYIRANGMEQLVRDVRIAQIQEGANGIQALDLLGRKMRQNEGRAFDRMVRMVERFLIRHRGEKAMAPFVMPLSIALARLAELVDWVRMERDPHAIGAAGVDAMRVFTLTLFAWMWARIAEVAMARAGTDPFYAGKLALAHYFMERMLPMAEGHAGVARAGSATLFSLTDAEI